MQAVQGFSATLDDLVFMPGLETPADRPYSFVYFVTITNNTPVPLTIIGRKWVVTEESGDRIVVEGEGVVGRTPRISPGESFSYNSYHVIGSPATVEGCFFAVTDAGEIVFTRMTAFRLELPGILP
jgi:ApaG protein